MEQHNAGFERLMQALRDILTGQPDFHGLIVVTSDGFHVASILPWDLGEARLAVISASLAALASSASRLALALGRIEHDNFAAVYLKASFGFVQVTGINDEMCLVAICKLETTFRGFDFSPDPLSPSPEPIFPWRPPGRLGAHAKPELDE